jgi:hypothetical protein
MELPFALTVLFWVIISGVFPYLTFGVLGLFDERWKQWYLEGRFFYKWLGYPYLIVYNALTNDWLAAGIWSLNLVIAWTIGPDDDDRWKKRRKRLAGKVKALNGRLVVVPVTEGN